MSDEKDPVRVGRFEWERLMLMSVPHPTNFKLLPIGVFMSADGGQARPGNAGLAQFGPHEKTWAKLLRWAVAEGWLIQVVRGGARRGPNGTTIVRASVYAASVPQSVWEHRMDVLGAPPFRASGVEGSASDPLKGAPDDSPPDPDSLKGAPEAPFNAPDSSLKGASKDSLPESLKGASGVFEGSDPSFEGSVSGFEGSAQALPHHVVLSSRSDSSSTSSTTVAAEDSADVTDTVTTEEGGGGGNLDSSEDQQQNDTRAEALVAQLDFRGKAPDKQQQKQLRVLVAAALAAGWSEGGLCRYLDISDDRDVKNAAGLYAYRLNSERLPDAGQAEAIAGALPPVCAMCSFKPGADTDPSLRVHPFGGPCPDCHPTSVGQSTTQLPPVCDTCRQQNPAAEFNIKFRQDPMSFTGAPCPDCHPDMVGGTGARATPHTADAYTSSSVDDLFAPRRGALVGTDAKVQGWMDLSRRLAAEDASKAGPKPMIANGYQPYSDPEDQSAYDEPL